MNIKPIYIIIFIIFFNSCKVSKGIDKTKTNRTLTENVETQVKRKGDTVTYTIPKVILKDTTIYTVNKQGTTLRTVYNQQGQISQIDCFASMIEEITRSNSLLVEAIKDKSKEKTEEFNPQYFIYSIGILLIIVIFGFIIINNKIKSL